MSEFCQVLVMMAAPAAFLLTLRRINIRADRAFDVTLRNENRPAQ